MSKPSLAKQGALTHADLLSAFHYCKLTGLFTRKTGIPGASAGSVAGSLKPSGYVLICVNRRFYRAHRLAWFYVTGQWPSEEMDHKNRDRSDNRWDNLREATKAENACNKAMRKDSKTGIKNVLRYQHSSSYFVRITASGVEYNFGPYSSAAAANKCAIEQRRNLHAAFATT